jgi:hypothetical protein
MEAGIYHPDIKAKAASQMQAALFVLLLICLILL